MNIMNDATVDEAVRKHEAEIAELKKPATEEEAQRRLSEMDDYDLSCVMPKGTRIGRIHRAKKGGVVQSFGFVNSAWGDVFVPPTMIERFSDEDRVAVLVTKTSRGDAADKIAMADDFISWHHDEIIATIIEAITSKKLEQLQWIGRRDPTYGWELMKKAVSKIGVELIEIRSEVRSSNYGGRGSTEYVLSQPVTEKIASDILDALGGRHEEKDPKGPYDPGHDRIMLTPNGFRNDWCGPWTD